jgi:hypothetical protein
MHRVLIISALLISIGAMAQTGHHDQISGGVHDTHFNFTHVSDWKDHQIVNYVRNDHTQGLIVFWKEGGIMHPLENMIAPRDTDSNSSYCPENKLGTNLTATLTYGYNDTRKNAGVYTISGSTTSANARTAIYQAPAPEDSADQPAQMISRINTHINGEAVRLRVVSIRRDEYVEYDFQFLEGKPTSLALNVQPRLFRYFADVGVQPKSGADLLLKYEKLPLREQIPDFKAYSLLQPTGPKWYVKIPSKTVQIRRQLLLMVNPEDNRVMASGFVTLHVPTGTE